MEHWVGHWKAKERRRERTALSQGMWIVAFICQRSTLNLWLLSLSKFICKVHLSSTCAAQHLVENCSSNTTIFNIFYLMFTLLFYISLPNSPWHCSISDVAALSCQHHLFSGSFVICTIGVPVQNRQDLYNCITFVLFYALSPKGYRIIKK